MPSQLKVWEGNFGKTYTDRNVIDWHTRLPAFQQMLAGLPIKRVLEVGCNRGHNLVALAELLGEGGDVVGIEPNRYALGLARGSDVRVGVLLGHASDFPFSDRYFDLVFTAGVLIHIPLTELPIVLNGDLPSEQTLHAGDRVPRGRRDGHSLSWPRRSAVETGLPQALPEPIP